MSSHDHEGDRSETASQRSDEWSDMMTGRYRALGKVDVFLRHQGLKTRSAGGNRASSAPTPRKDTHTVHVKSPLSPHLFGGQPQQQSSSQASSPLFPRTPRSNWTYSTTVASNEPPGTASSAAGPSSNQPDTPTHVPKRVTRGTASASKQAFGNDIKERIAQWKISENIPLMLPKGPDVPGFTVVLVNQATCNVCGHNSNTKGKRTLYECESCKWCICSTCLSARQRNTSHVGCSAVADIDTADLPLQSVEFPESKLGSSKGAGKQGAQAQAKVSVLPDLPEPRGKKGSSPKRFLPYRIGRRHRSLELDSQGSPTHRGRQGCRVRSPPRDNVEIEKRSNAALDALTTLAPVVLGPSIKAEPAECDPFAPVRRRTSVRFAEEDTTMLDNDQYDSRSILRGDSTDDHAMELEDSMSPPCDPPLPTHIFYDVGRLSSDRFEPVKPAAGDMKPDYEADNNAWQALLEAARFAVEKEKESPPPIAVRGVSPSQISYVHSPTESTFDRQETVIHPAEGYIPLKSSPFRV